MLRERLAEQGVLILDGALATELERRGCNLQDSLWSAKMLMEEPEKIRQVHEDCYRAGADLFACETIPSLVEAKAILRALEDCTLPCWMSFSCRDAAHISEGTPIAACAEFLDGQDRVEAIGVNCTAPEYIEGLIREIRRASDKPVVVYGDSGEQYDPAEKVWHGRETAPCYADWASKWYAAGARILGGCCRTTPADIAAIYAWREQMLREKQ